MSHLPKDIIQAVIDRKPLAVKEAFELGVREKAKEIVDECTIVFESDDEYDEFDLNETLFEEDIDDGLEHFFQEFHDKYGHLPVEEQEEIMAAFEAALEEGNPDPETAVTHINEPLAGEHKPHLKPEGSSPGGIEDTGEMTSRVYKKKKTFKAETNNHA